MPGSKTKKSKTLDNKSTEPQTKDTDINLINDADMTDDTIGSSSMNPNQKESSKKLMENKKDLSEKMKDKKGKREKKEKKVRKEKKTRSRNYENEDSQKNTPKSDMEIDEPTQSISTNPGEFGTDDGFEKPSSKKRKRAAISGDELQIDLSAPEPPSKKTLRKIKKNPALAEKLVVKAAKKAPKPSTADSTAEAPKKEFPEHASQSRSKWGVWMGNLAFTTTSSGLQEFLTRDPSTITREDITRINLPMSSTGKNKGFAYVDFKTKQALDCALSLTEGLIGGRRVLIKSANDFSNRPAAAAENAPKAGANISRNPPSKILYVGNLDFDINEGDLKNHFAFAGKVLRVRLATFEDSGKCKGFGFVDFDDEGSVRRAMLGLTPEEEEVYEELEGKIEVEILKKRRNRGIVGTRPVAMEYGQDPATRYKKRFGKKNEESALGGDMSSQPNNGVDQKVGEQKRHWKGADNRSADAGAVYSRDARRSGAITASAGRKMTFSV
jgi:RNA recognition motif-containing protein